MFSLTHSRSRLHGRGRGQRSQDMSSLKTESNFNLRQPPSRGQHSPQSEVKAQQRNSRCTKKQKGRLEMETDLFYIKTFGSGGAEAAGNHHSPFPSARRCRLSGTSSRRPRCSTTARPRGWWALRPSPEPSESFACTCTQRHRWVTPQAPRGGRRGLGSPLHWLVSKLHQQPDGGGSRVELGDVIFVHDLPHTAHVGVGGQTLELTHTKDSCTKITAGSLEEVPASDHQTALDSSIRVKPSQTHQCYITRQPTPVNRKSERARTLTRTLVAPLASGP